MNILKRKDFARWQENEKLSDLAIRRFKGDSL